MGKEIFAQASRCGKIRHFSARSVERMIGDGSAFPTNL